MKLISLNVDTRSGKTVGAAMLIDVTDIGRPIEPVGGGQARLWVREWMDKRETTENIDLIEYVVNHTPAAIAALTPGYLVSLSVTERRGEVVSYTRGFLVTDICGYIKTVSGGSSFLYREGGDIRPVEYKVSQTITQILSATNTTIGLMNVVGAIDAGSNPNYPAAEKGDCYYISNGGKVGGLSGQEVEVGDFVICIADNAGGNQATVGSSWDIVQFNMNTYLGQTSGPANAYVSSSSIPLVAGRAYTVRINASNTAASTLTVNSTAYPIVKAGTTALAAGDLVANRSYVMIFDSGVRFKLLLDTQEASTSDINTGTDGNVYISPKGLAYALVEGQLQYTYPQGGDVADAYVHSTNPAGTTLVSGAQIRFNCVASNTGASTLNYNGTGAIAIKKASTREPLRSGDLVAGKLYNMTFDQGEGAWLLQDSKPTTGDVALVAGTVAVALADITAGARVFLSRRTAGASPGHLTYVVNAGVGFTITSTDAADTGNITWMVEY